MSTRAIAIPRRVGTLAPSGHTDFFKYLASKQPENRIAQRPKPLSAEEHAAHRKQLQQVKSIKPKYAAETEINVANIFAKWKRYCTEMKVGDWKLTIQNITRETMMDFFRFVCENYKINTQGSLGVYIRQFSQMHTTITGRYIDRNDMKELYKYYDQFLIVQFGLRPPNIDGKPVLNVDSLQIILAFNLAYDKNIFPLERHRISLSACYMIICYTGARPAELVDNERQRPKDGTFEQLFAAKVVMAAEHNDGEAENDEEVLDDRSRKLHRLLLRETIRRDRPKALCYEDILMMIVRDPATGRSIPAMSIKFVHHKGCDKKPKPTIFFFTPAKRLLFCPLLVFTSLALHDKAFDALCLRDAKSIFEIEVPSGMSCLPLRWKKSMLKTPVFRRILNNGTLSDEAMPYFKLRDDIGRQSLDAGFEEKWTPRFGRRGAANAANGNAPDAVRDQMMRHNPEFYTFQDAYLNQIANFDLQNAFLEEQTEDQLFRVFAHVSLTRDPRATRDMVPADVWENQKPDPEIVEMEEKRKELKQGQYRIQDRDNETEVRKLTDKIKAKRAYNERKTVKKYREYYFYNRPTWDLERQARGEDMEEYTEPAIDLVIPERARLAEILCHQPKELTIDEISQRRIEAVDLYVTLCGKKETVKRSRTKTEKHTKLPTPKRIKLETTPEPELDRFPLLMEATQCPDCIGDEAQTFHERTFPYCRPTKRNDHFDDHHLEEKEHAERYGKLIACKHPRCKQADVKLQSVDEFRNHVQSVHGVSLRPSQQAQQRRERKCKLRRSRGSE